MIHSEQSQSRGVVRTFVICSFEANVSEFNGVLIPLAASHASIFTTMCTSSPVGVVSITTGSMGKAAATANVIRVGFVIGTSVMWRTIT
jgi:hypothetical protein